MALKDKFLIFKNVFKHNMDFKPKHGYEEVLDKLDLMDIKGLLYEKLDEARKRLMNKPQWLEEAELAVLLKMYIDKSHQNYTALKKAAVEKLMKKVK
jgi:hypothetical protein